MAISQQLWTVMTGATSGVVTITGPALLLTEAILIDTDSTSAAGVSFTSTTIQLQIRLTITWFWSC